MITVSTTSEAEARAMADLLRERPAWHDWRVYHMGSRVASSADSQRLHPAQERMRQLLAERGADGYQTRKLWDQLNYEGPYVARETVQRWLVRDEQQGYVVRKSNLWVWAGKS
jgi:hypothetical protein